MSEVALMACWDRRFGGVLVAVAVIGLGVPAACAAAPGSGEPAAGREAAKPAAGAGEREARRAQVRLPDGGVVIAEIADTPARWARGYMFRRAVGEGEGMVFVFPEAGFHPFWMKNTLVPLDIIWMDDEWSILHIESQVPPCRADPCPHYGPPRKARFVLEIRGGGAERAGLKLGDRLRISFPEPID